MAISDGLRIAALGHYSSVAIFRQGVPAILGFQGCFSPRRTHPWNQKPATCPTRGGLLAVLHRKGPAGLGGGWGYRPGFIGNLRCRRFLRGKGGVDKARQGTKTRKRGPTEKGRDRSGLQSRALTQLNAAIVTAIEAVTGDTRPWMQTPRAELHPGIKAAGWRASRASNNFGLTKATKWPGVLPPLRSARRRSRV
jgi:hypothetical protein